MTYLWDGDRLRKAVLVFINIENVNASLEVPGRKLQPVRGDSCKSTESSLA